MPKSRCIVLLLFCLAFPDVGFAQFTGKVVDVADGDTVMVMIDRQLLKLDVVGIDAPRPGQPYAARARKSLEEMCENKTAIVDDLGIGTGRHMFGSVVCDGVDAALEQVRRGLAWAGGSDAPANSPLASIEAGARAEHRGLWKDAAPIPPWKWPHAKAPRMN